MCYKEIEVKKLEQIETDLAFIKEYLIKGNKESLSDEWIESKQASKELKVCPKTWENYRKKGIIPFSQFGSKIWVKRKDIDLFLERNYIKKS